MPLDSPQFQTGHGPTQLRAQAEALIAEAQAEGYLKGLEVDTAMSIINQMVSCYLQPYLIAVVDDRLSEEKHARGKIILTPGEDGDDGEDGEDGDDEPASN